MDGPVPLVLYLFIESGTGSDCKVMEYESSLVREVTCQKGDCRARGCFQYVLLLNQLRPVEPALFFAPMKRRRASKAMQIYWPLVHVDSLVLLLSYFPWLLFDAQGSVQ